MADYRVIHVASFKKGTVVSLAPNVAFFDKNNNRVLDEKDVKFEYGYGEDYKCYGNIKKERYFCTANVNKDDICKYGPTVNRLFSLARKERSMMKNAVKPQREGICYLDETFFGAAFVFDAAFAPPLSLRTTIYPKDFRYNENPEEKNEKPTVDPRKCDYASASFITSFRDRELKMVIHADDHFVLLHDSRQEYNFLTYLNIEEAGFGSSPVSITSVHYRVPSLEGGFTLYHVYLVAKNQCRQVYLNEALK